MKRATLTSLLLLAGCSGNWSNKDLEFVSALPHKADLQSKLPVSTSVQPLSGEGTRKDGLGLGETSQAYLDAKKASSDFNGLLDGLLAIVEAVRSLPPTTRETDARTWGPFPDDKNPGYEAQLVIRRVDPLNFSWAIQFRLKDGPGDWFDVAVGNFLASGGIRRGKGAVELRIAENVDKLKSLQGLSQISRITMGYQTDTTPLTVDMAFTFAAGNTAGYSEAGYGYRENADRAGKMAFSLRTLDPNVVRLDATAGWLASGAGVATATVIEGNYQGANAVECWDTAFQTVYVKQSWPGGLLLGDPAACVTLPF